MINRRRLRRLVVKRFQIRLAMASMLYVYVGAMAFAAMVFGPLIFKLLSSSTPDMERTEIANAFLSLHGTTWAGLGMLLLVTALSFIVSSHRVAGPLVRFQNVFKALRRGDVSDRVKLRDGDWLHEEAADLDVAIRHLRRRIVLLQRRNQAVGVALAKLKSAAPASGPTAWSQPLADLERAHARVSANLNRFVVTRAHRSTNPKMQADTKDEAWRKSKAGFTLVELLAVCALTGTLMAIAGPLYGEALNAARETRAIADVRGIGREITAYQIANGEPPDSLADVGYESNLDPWQRPYQYLVIAGKKGLGGVRKDHKLNPINSDFDLYSFGRDGASKTQISNKDSLDDIIRANDGGFVGLAKNF